VRRVAWTLLFLAAATVCQAESLAEIAARTKAAREKTKPAPKPAANGTEESAPPKEYGQADLERVADPVRRSSEPASRTATDEEAQESWSADESESTAPPSVASPGMQQLEARIRHWRARCLSLKETVEYRRRSLADLEAYEKRALEDQPRGELRSGRKERLDARVDEARASLARAEEELSACEDDARRDGVSAGQLE
jgi:hypothetical protein